MVKTVGFLVEAHVNASAADTSQVMNANFYYFIKHVFSKMGMCPADYAAPIDGVKRQIG